MKIALIPFNPVVAAVQDNSEKILGFVDEAIAQQCQLIIFPEMSLIGYPAKDYLFYPFLLEQQNSILQKIKRRSKKIAIVVGGFQKNKKAGRPFFNTALIFLNGQKYVYNKQLLPNYDVFDDWRYFSPGSKPLVLKIGGKKFGFTICEDIWFHEDQIKTKYDQDPLNGYSDKKLDYLINISASPYEIDKTERRVRLLTKVSQTVKCSVIYVNQVGANDDLVFDGTALVYNKAGQLLFKTPAFEEKTFIFDDSMTKTVPTKKTDITEMYIMLEKALITGIHDYVIKSGFSKVLLGLSGGVDSALVAYLATKALGPDNVLGVLMPSRYSSKESVTDALELAENLQIKTMTIPIDPLHKQYEKVFKKIFAKNIHDLTEQNVQARIRGNLLMAISNNSGSLLLNTTNKSEMAVGYGTLYGDLCGALCVLSDVAKTQVYELCAYINREQEIIPQNILNKAPSAELKPNQKDTDSLPPYDVLDDAIYNLINEHGDGANFKKDITHTTFGRIVKNEYKRFQTAPGLRISSKAFGIGRRIPVVGKVKIE